MCYWATAVDAAKTAATRMSATTNCRFIFPPFGVYWRRILTLLRATETYRGHARVRITEVTIRHQFFHAVPSLVCIARAADAFVSPALGASRIVFRHERIVIAVVPIIRPLHDVSNNVI